MAYGTGNAYERALDLVKAGLSGGAIKLQGSAAYESNNKEQSRFDADYLNSLINSIAENLIKQAPLGRDR